MHAWLWAMALILIAGLAHAQTQTPSRDTRTVKPDVSTGGLGGYGYSTGTGGGSHYGGGYMRGDGSPVPAQGGATHSTQPEGRATFNPLTGTFELRKPRQ